MRHADPERRDLDAARRAELRLLEKLERERHDAAELELEVYGDLVDIRRRPYRYMIGGSK